MSNKIAILTALSGTREKLVDPRNTFLNADYFAFTDNISQDVGIWKQIPLLHFSNDSRFAARRNAKIYKILPHLFLPNYEYYIWHDVSHSLVADPEEVCEKYLRDSDIAVFKHTQRDCAYAEANIINELNYDHRESVDSQVSFYKSQGFPENYGLYELPVSIRRNTKSTQVFNQMWYEQINRFSSRDQISFPYCLWKTGINPVIMPGFANGRNSDGSLGMNPILPQIREHVSSGPG